MRNSVKDRVKVTKNGKVVRRSMRIGNFRTRKTSKSIRQKRNPRSLAYPIKKIINL